MKPRHEYTKTYREKLKTDVLNYYGTSCAVCGFDDPRALQIDHVNGGGNEERLRVGGSKNFSGWNFYRWLRKNKYPEGYQTLCANHNMIKHVESSNLLSVNGKPDPC